MKKGAFWRTDLQIFGYWDEVPDTYKHSKVDYEFNPHCKNYIIGDIVVYNTKMFKFLGHKPQIDWSWIDKTLNWVITCNNQFRYGILL